MLKKIYQELVAIRKELQAIKGSMEPQRRCSTLDVELTDKERARLAMESTYRMPLYSPTHRR